MNEKMDYT